MRWGNGTLPTLKVGGAHTPLPHLLFALENNLPFLHCLSHCDLNSEKKGIFSPGKQKINIIYKDKEDFT